jgi:hypothetical protein
MRKTRSSGSVEGVMGNHDPYSDRCAQDDRSEEQGSPRPPYTCARNRYGHF